MAALARIIDCTVLFAWRGGIVGANIAALFPIIETTLHGQSLQVWNQKRLDDSQASLAAHQADATKLEQSIAAAKDAKQKSELGFELDVLNTQIKVDKPASIRPPHAAVFRTVHALEAVSDGDADRA